MPISSGANGWPKSYWTGKPEKTIHQTPQNIRIISVVERPTTLVRGVCSSSQEDYFFEGPLGANHWRQSELDVEPCIQLIPSTPEMQSRNPSCSGDDDVTETSSALSTVQKQRCQHQEMSSTSFSLMSAAASKGRCGRVLLKPTAAVDPRLTCSSRERRGRSRPAADDDRRCPALTSGRRHADNKEETATAAVAGSKDAASRGAWTVRCQNDRDGDHGIGSVSDTDTHWSWRQFNRLKRAIIQAGRRVFGTSNNQQSRWYERCMTSSTARYLYVAVAVLLMSMFMTSVVLWMRITPPKSACSTNSFEGLLLSEELQVGGESIDMFDNVIPDRITEPCGEQSVGMTYYRSKASLTRLGLPPVT